MVGGLLEILKISWRVNRRMDNVFRCLVDDFALGSKVVLFLVLEWKCLGGCFVNLYLN
jgi:hypothetical protein